MPWIYLDNNIFNLLAADEQADQIIEEVRSQYLTRASLLLLAEIGATEDATKRNRMLTIAKRLCRATNVPPLDDPRIIVQRQVSAFVKKRSTINPLISLINSNRRQLWSLLRDPNSLNDDLSRALLEIKQVQERWHQEMFDALRPRIQELKDVKGKSIGKAFDLISFLKHFRKQDDFLREEVANIVSTTPFMKQVAGHELELLRSNDVWRYFFVSMGVATYNRAFQLNNYSVRRNAGGIDTVQAVYFAFTDIFVTDDVAHKGVLEVVRRYSLGQRRPKVWTYSDLRRELNIPTAT